MHVLVLLFDTNGHRTHFTKGKYETHVTYDRLASYSPPIPTGTVCSDPGTCSVGLKNSMPAKKYLCILWTVPLLKISVSRYSAITDFLDDFQH